MATPANTGTSLQASAGSPISAGGNPQLPGPAAAPPTNPYSYALSPIERVSLACQKATPALVTLFQEFWGIPADIRFFGVTAHDLYCWRTDDFFVAELPLNPKEAGPDLNARLRLSDSAIAGLLTHALGARPKSHFQLSDLTPLEGQMLNEFAKSMFMELKQNQRLIQKPDTKKSPTRRSRNPQNVYQLVWLVHSAFPNLPQLPPEAFDPKKLDANKPERLLQFLPPPAETGKLILTIPAMAFRMPEETELPVRPVKDTFFLDATAVARIGLGGTRVTLSDMKALEDGDVVVLTHSQTDQMQLLGSPESSEAGTPRHNGIPFYTELGPVRKKISLPFTQDINAMEQDTKQTLWDNLMIDVGAEFEPIRMPLKQLRQMSEGLVVEVGDILHNRVHLKVEGKTLAQGELVIVGDKFGVRISKVNPEREAADAARPAGQKMTAQGPAHGMDPGDIAPPAAANAEETDDDEDFLLDDDENDDEGF